MRAHASMSICVCGCPWRPEEVIGSPETGVTGGFELHGEAGSKLGALEEQVLTTDTFL